MVLFLFDEIRDVRNWLLKVTDALLEPQFDLVCSLLVDPGHQLLNFLLKLFRCWGELLLYLLAVDLHQPNVGAGG